MLRQWISLILLSLTEGCGVAVHSYLVERILPFLPAHIVRNEAYVRAGAFYPDAFYDCMGQYDVAEEAHWPPFLAAGVEIVRKRRASGLHDTASLEAFLVGVMTHQVADISWHSLGIFQGLLRAMTSREFDGDYDDAHTVLDVGGDMIQLNRLAADPQHSKWLNSEWNYNPADIQELQRAVGYTDISQSAIRYCMTRGKAALNAEMNVASVGYKRFARRSPLLFDELETYFIGGSTDMQQQIEECMPRFMEWLRGAPVPDPWDLCQVFDGKRPRDGQDDENDFRRRKGPDLLSIKGIVEIFKDAKSSAQSGLQRKTAAALQCAIIPAPASKSDDEHSSGSETYRPHFGANVIPWKDRWAVASPNEAKVYVYDEHFKHNLTISAKRPNKVKGKFATQFGTAMAEWEDYIIVSSPGLSTLDFFDQAGNWSGTITWKDKTTEYGHRGTKMVGQTLAVDADLGSVYVGAPYYDDMELDEPDQVGAVYVLPRDLIRKAVRRTVMKLGHNENLMVKGDSPYERLGTQLSVTPRFVLVGSPGKAKVYGFDFATHKKILTLDDGSTNTESDNSGFGGYVLSGNKDYVVIGAPASSDKSGTQNGKVTIYKNTQMQSIAGSAEFEWFGTGGVQTTMSKQPTMLLASPHAADGRGMLWTLDLHTQELAALGSPPVPAGSGFGRSVACNGTTAVIGMPFHQGVGPRLGAIAVVPL